jgi:hypothetical protein
VSFLGFPFASISLSQGATEVCRRQAKCKKPADKTVSLAKVLEKWWLGGRKQFLTIYTLLLENISPSGSSPWEISAG